MNLSTVFYTDMTESVNKSEVAKDTKLVMFQ